MVMLMLWPDCLASVLMLLFVLCFLLNHQVVYTKKGIELPCNGTHEFKSDSEKVHLKSPNFPKEFETGDYCRWLIKGSFRNTLKVKFESFKIGKSSSKNCTESNYLLFEDFGFRERICLDKKPAQNQLVFNGSLIEIQFVAQGTGKKGFHLVITSESVSCGRVITSEKIKSLSMKNVTKDSTMCAWKFTAKVNVTIKLTCSSINLRKSKDCHKEALLVNVFGDNLFLENDKYCGKRKLKKALSYKNKMNIVFFTNKRSKKRGFNCSIIHLHKPVKSDKRLIEDCGKNTNLLQKLQRIVEGEEATPRIPMVGLWIQSLDSFGCGGVLIHPQIVLTAAHCLDNVTQEKPEIYVPGDEEIGQYYPMTGYKVHEHFHPRMIFNDIALIRITNSTNVEEKDVACLAPRNFKTLKKSMEVFGWGMTLRADKEPNATFFYKLTVTGTPRKECDSWFWENGYTVFTERSFCTAAEPGKSPCFGDSGGPALLIRKKRLTVVGINSMGNPSCSAPPTGFTHVSLFRKWIMKNVKLLLKKEEL